MRPLQFVEPDARQVFRIEERLTYYDATYVALAGQEDAGPVTVDGPMAEAARAMGLDVRTF